uniref:cell adhesion molecule 2-like isoform X1 n=2 Tax=Myxine glutinosa TaxID=7769 RepID=UPI00358DF48C
MHRLISVLLIVIVTVNGQEPSSSNVTAVLGELAMLRCEVQNADESSIQWSNPARQTLFFDEKKALKDSRIELVNAGRNELTISISNVSLSDEGPYRCSVFAQVVNTVTAYLSVIATPSEPMLSGYEGPLFEGSEMLLSCQSEGGRPLPRLLWNHNGHPVMGKEREAVLEGGTVMVISHLAKVVGREDDGTSLTCEVFHETLKTSLVASITLEVYYPPVLFIQRRGDETRLLEGRSLELDCIVEGKPRPEAVKWQRLGEGLPEKADVVGGTLRISPLNRTDNGTYRCQSSNMAGTSHVDFNLIVHEAGEARMEVELGVDLKASTAVSGSKLKDLPLITSPPHPLTLGSTPSTEPLTDPGMLESRLGTDTAVIGGVVAVVVFVTLCLLIVIGRYLARHKGTYLTHEAKGAEDAPDADTAIINAEGGPASAHEKKEYFI